MSNSNGIILLVSGPISVLSSTIVIIMVLRSRVKLSNSYHRLMFGMSVADIILSSALSFSSIPAPIGTPNTWKALGTQSTCNAQGIFFGFGAVAAPCYFLSLQIYYLFMIKYQTRIENIRKVEPYLHVAPILLGLTCAFVPFGTDSINPGSRGYCWIDDFPLHCTPNQNIECIRGKTAYIQRFFLNAFPSLVIWILNGIIMWMIYASVREQDRRNATHDFQSSVRQSPHNDRMHQPSDPPRRRSVTIRSPEEILNTQYQKSRRARKRVLQYFMAYSLTFSVPLIDWILHNVKSTDNMLQICYLIFYPLGGFYNLVVFIIPAVRRVQERNAEFCLLRVYFTAILTYVGPSGGDSPSIRRVRRASHSPQITLNLENIEEQRASISPQIVCISENIEDRVSSDKSNDNIGNNLI